jgi:mono/diheme cytochrome c family protein
VIRALAAAAVLALGPVAVRSDEPGATTIGRTTIWDGVFTEAQSARGEFVYPAVCGRCHGYKLDGAPDDPDMFSTPPIAGAKFLREWNGATLAALYEYTKAAMPAINPGSLSDQEFVDVVAYTLAISGAPPGPTELQPDAGALTSIFVVPRP